MPPDVLRGKDHALRQRRGGGVSLPAGPPVAPLALLRGLLDDLVHAATRREGALRRLLRNNSNKQGRQRRETGGGAVLSVRAQV